jgi:hypothetical protein
MCSLVDRARQLWEALVFLARNREWEGGSFFANRLVESLAADGRVVHVFNICAGRIPVVGDGLPDDAAADMTEAAIYELCAKGGLMIIGAPPGGQGSRRPVELQRPVSDHLALAGEERRLWLVDLEQLLAYDLVRRHLEWSASTDEGQVTIRITGVNDGHGNAWSPTLEELEGITFYTPDAANTRVLLGNRELTGLSHNPRDRTLRESVTIHGSEEI